ncbi:MAG TPA: SDR family oxidoreductase [Candidatus Binataceae bacterium]|nr:SDR family oxidoreductase [Candidatus Binataceae bacterium]
MASPKMFDLEGKVAVVTGGNGGIGRGIALGLAQAGASIAILARNPDKTRVVIDEIKKHNVPTLAVTLDVTKRETLRPALEEVERTLGPIDILVNNAGISIQRTTLKLEAESWDRVIETNLSAVFLLSQVAAQSMVKRKHGKIINIASEYARFGSAAVPSYAAAKGGVVQLTKSMAIELGRHNIQVNAIVPGWIWTDMTTMVKGTPFYDEIITRTPAGRFGDAEEMAGTAIFLASDASNFVTGAIVYADGGFAIR